MNEKQQRFLNEFIEDLEYKFKYSKIKERREIVIAKLNTAIAIKNVLLNNKE